MLQPSRLSEAMELVKKELRIYSSLQTASGPQLSVSTKYAPTQLRAFLEAKYANQRQHQSPPHIQQAWVEQFEEEIEQQELEPVRTYQHTQGQVLQTEDPDEQSAVSEEEDRQTDALKLMLQAQIKSQNFLEQEVERLTVELNEKTRHEFESRTPARPAPSPSPARSRAQKIPNARTMPVEEKKETIRKQALVKLPGKICTLERLAGDAHDAHDATQFPNAWLIYKNNPKRVQENRIFTSHRRKLQCISLGVD